MEAGKVRPNQQELRHRSPQGKQHQELRRHFQRWQAKRHRQGQEQQGHHQHQGLERQQEQIHLLERLGRRGQLPVWRERKPAMDQGWSGRTGIFLLRRQSMTQLLL